MSRLNFSLTAILITALFAGVARAEPPPTTTAARRELYWFEAPLPVAPAVRRKATRPRIKLSARKSRYGNITLESLAARERGKPMVECALSCGAPQHNRVSKARATEKRVTDLARAVQLYR